MVLFHWKRTLLLLPAVLCLAAKPAPSKPPAPPAGAKPVASPTESALHPGLDPDLMVFKIHLARYLNYCDAIRELRKDLPPSKVLDDAPLAGAMTIFQPDDLWRQMTMEKKSKAQVLKEWTDTIGKRWADRRREMGAAGQAMVEKRVESPASQTELFIEWMNNQTLSLIKLTPEENMAARPAARRVTGRFISVHEKYRAAVIEATFKHQPLPPDPWDAAAMEQWRSAYWSTVLQSLPPDGQAQMQKSWALLYPKGPASPTTKPAAPPVVAAASPAEQAIPPGLDPDLMAFRICLTRYLNYCEAIRDLRKDLPASQVLDAPPLEGTLIIFQPDDLRRQMTMEKKSKAQVLKEWTDSIEKRWADHRRELGAPGVAMVEKRVESPTSQTALFIEWMNTQTLLLIKMTPQEDKAVWAAARRAMGRFFSVRDKYLAAVTEATFKHQPLPSDPWDAAAMEQFRSAYWSTVLQTLPPDGQAQMQRSWVLLYPKGPAAPEIKPATRPVVAAPASQPAIPGPAIATKPPDVAAPPAAPGPSAPASPRPVAPATGPVVVQAPPPPSMPPPAGKTLAGSWTTTKDGLEERWSIQSEADGWHVTCVYRKSGKEVGSCHGEGVKYTDGEIDFIRVFEKRPREDIVDHAPAKIIIRNGHADLMVNAGPSKSFKKTLDRAGG